MIKHIVAITFLILSCYFSFAQDDEIETDRPDQTDSPLPVDKGQVQVEQGFKMEKDEGISTITSNTLLRYGLLKQMELRLEGDLVHTLSTSNSSSATELQPIEIGTKIPLWQQLKWLPQTSFLAHVGLPFLAAKSFTGLKAMPGIKLAFQNDLSKTITLGYNAGAEWDGETSDPEYIYSFSNGIDLSKKLHGFIEFYGSVKNHESAQDNIDAGLALLINNNFKVDASSSVGITKAAPDWAISVGASLRFNKGKK